MDGRELYSIAREFLDREFGLELDIPIFINPRMKSMFGCFRTKKGEAWQIDMSKEFMDTHPREHVIDVLKHECIHYALFTLKKPYSDKDKYFKDTCDRLGVKRTRHYRALGKFHEYTCNCGKKFHRKRKLSEGSHCQVCKTLKYVGVIEKSLN
jgi:SprT-like protein